MIVTLTPNSSVDRTVALASPLARGAGADGEVLEADPAAAVEAAAKLVARGDGAVLATLSAHGAVLVTVEGAWHAAPPPSTVSAPWARATPASSATSSASCAALLLPTGCAWPWPTAAPPPACPAPPSRAPSRCTPASSRSSSSPPKT